MDFTLSGCSCHFRKAILGCFWVCRLLLACRTAYTPLFFLSSNTIVIGPGLQTVSGHEQGRDGHRCCHCGEHAGRILARKLPPKVVRPTQVTTLMKLKLKLKQWLLQGAHRPRRFTYRTDSATAEEAAEDGESPQVCAYSVALVTCCCRPWPTCRNGDAQARPAMSLHLPRKGAGLSQQTSKASQTLPSQTGPVTQQDSQWPLQCVEPDLSSAVCLQISTGFHLKSCLPFPCCHEFEPVLFPSLNVVRLVCLSS